MTKDEALKIALEALETALDFDIDAEDGYYLQAITAIKEALAQPEQEPVEWPRTMERGALVQWLHFEMVQHTLDEGTIDKLIEDAQAIPATPPQRTWVGLTESDISDVCASNHPLDGVFTFARAIEAKLKERNT